VDLGLPWDPWEDAERWQRAFGLPTLPAERQQWIWGGAAPAVRPAVEVLRRGDDVVVRAEVPGMRPEDIDVRLESDAVTLRGELRQETHGERDGVYHSERRYGAFVRRLRLPVPVAADKARATYRDGVLEVVAPAERAAPGPRRIPVQGAGA
jgi:HSP20 family protein